MENSRGGGVHFDTVAGGELIVTQGGEPFGEDLGVHILKRLGQRAGAGEHGPGQRRDGPGDEPIGDGLAGGVVVGDQVFEGVMAHLRVDVDAIFAAHHAALSGGEMRLPELGDRLLRPLIGEGPGAAQDGKGFLLRFAVGWILSHGRIFFSIFLALFCPNQHCPRSGLTGGDCSFDYRTAGVHSGPELPEEPESPEPPVETG